MLKDDVDKRIRVCMVMPKLQVGGAEVQVLNLIRKIDRSRFALSLCLFNEGHAEMEKTAAEHVESVFILNFRWRRFPVSFFRLVRYLRKGRFDVVHAHLAPADLVGRAAAWMAGVPVRVTTEHGKGLWKSGARLLVERMLNGITDARICVSRDIMEIRRAREHTPANKLVYIPNAVDPEQFGRPARGRDAVMAEFGWPAGDPLVLSVGRIVKEKDYPLLIEAFTAMAAKVPRARCIIAGDGDRMDEVRAVVKKNGMEDRIALPGTRNDVSDLLSAADLFVLSSEREGLPVSLLEAMAAGTAIVTTDVGGVGEAVIEGESALMVMHGDASALASAMERVLTDAVLREKLINNASRAVEERFSMNSAASTLGDLYERLVAKKENG